MKKEFGVQESEESIPWLQQPTVLVIHVRACRPVMVNLLIIQFHLSCTKMHTALILSSDNLPYSFQDEVVIV